MNTKKAEHTPGPWHYQEKADEYTHIIRAENDVFICSCPQNSLQNSKANARLIAASPELLIALRALVVACGPYSGMPIEQARAAIAKAEGK